MENDKIEEQLNLALNLTQEEREGNEELNVGYDRETNEWELMVRFSGTADGLRRLVKDYGGTVDVLAAQFAIVILKQNLIEAFANEVAVIYIEKAKNLNDQLRTGIEASCPFLVQESRSLNGEGVLIGIADSGVDVLHPDFLRPDGKSAFVGIWDQGNMEGEPPDGYSGGTFYSEKEIAQMIEEKRSPVFDPTGHGTHVASIAAGNRGMATKAQIVFVKLARSKEGELARTTSLMRAVDFLISFAEKRKMPISMNISYGTNYGDHQGGSLIEAYLDEVGNRWQTVICVGSGNEGDTARHKQGRLGQRTERIEFLVAPYERTLNLQIWKEYVDEMEIVLISPGGIRYQFAELGGFGRVLLGQTKLFFYYGTPTPYNKRQEIFLAFSGEENGIESGEWAVELIPRKIRDGRYQMWLPVSENASRTTRFMEPSINWTITIPATADGVISVGAYNARLQTYASFSGRGDYEECVRKPDLVAPGVNILAAAPGGGQSIRSGTSMAVPFVSGAAALLMEWGIVRKNDIFLYGEKLKAYLIRGAKKLPFEEGYPNDQVGWGSLCVRDSLEK